MCGIFGISNHAEASRMTYLGLYALQHRGELGAGIATWNQGDLSVHGGSGLVQDVFTEEQIAALKGEIAIGHNRCATAGNGHDVRFQPILIECAYGKLAVCMDGRIANANALRKELIAQRATLQTDADAELLANLIARVEYDHRKDPYDDLLLYALTLALDRVRGAYSFLIIQDNRLFAGCDPLGLRPLTLGKLGRSLVVSSETCALDLAEATWIKDVEPGEILLINSPGITGEEGVSRVAHSTSIRGQLATSQARCVFELAYRGRPDSVIFGQTALVARNNIGRILAQENPIKSGSNTIVVPVPDSGRDIAIGYAKELGIKLELQGIIRNHYVYGMQAFAIRDPLERLRIKYNVDKHLVFGKRIILIVSSMLRANTVRFLITELRKSGAKQIHVRVGFPPFKFPCEFGVPTPPREELRASNSSSEEMCKFVDATSLSFISPEGLFQAVGRSENKSCSACFTGRIPITMPQELVAILSK